MDLRSVVVPHKTVHSVSLAIQTSQADKQNEETPSAVPSPASLPIFHFHPTLHRAVTNRAGRPPPPVHLLDLLVAIVPQQLPLVIINMRVIPAPRKAIPRRERPRAPQASPTTTVNTPPPTTGRRAVPPPVHRRGRRPPQALHDKRYRAGDRHRRADRDDRVLDHRGVAVEGAGAEPGRGRDRGLAEPDLAELALPVIVHPPARGRGQRDGDGDDEEQGQARQAVALLELGLLAWAGVHGCLLVEFGPALAGRQGDPAVACWLVVFDLIGVLLAPLDVVDGLEAGDELAVVVVVELEVVVAVGRSCQ